MEQKKALEILKSGQNAFVTGPAGSGKTYLLNQFIAYLRKKKIRVAKTASTGIAATHMNGLTIHSWSGMGIYDSIDNQIIKSLKKQDRLVKRLGKTEVLIIDEVSMLHDFQLDMLDKICKAFKDPFLPFGGLQIVLSGDLFQLPPISRGDDPVRPVIHSRAWQEADLQVCYLDKQYRQDDKIMLKVLNAIRERKIDKEIKDILKTRENKEIKNVENPTRLFSHNANVDDLNNIELNKVEGDCFRYNMKSTGYQNVVKALKRGCLAPDKLYLKKGAKVMFVKNNFEKGYVNGTTGVVAGFDKSGFPIVKTHIGEKILAEPERWVAEAEDGFFLGEIKQIPLRLAWAITIHKSQGMTLDGAEMDLRETFEYGMGYVALSRCRRLDGIKLLGFNEMALQVDPEIFKIDAQLKKLSG
jgi:hypothetical protein